MSEDASAKGAQRRQVGRSPAYPNLTVQKALERARELYEKEGEYPTPVAMATAAWGYSAKSSGARQTIATLKYYGLIEVTGDGDARKVKVSEVARRIILDGREDQTEKKQLIRKVALTPSIHRALNDEYGAKFPSDGSVIHWLVFEQGYNRSAAAELLAEYKETAKFAGINEPVKSVDKNADAAQTGGQDKALPEIKIGDRVQWTSQGADQFPKGALVLGFSDDGQWLFTDQGTSGVPVRETTVMESVQTPPQIPAHLIAALTGHKPLDSLPDTPGTRKAVFPVGDGDVTLIFPEGISADGLEELGQYLNIFLKKEQKQKTGTHHLTA